MLHPPIRPRLPDTAFSATATGAAVTTCSSRLAPKYRPASRLTGIFRFFGLCTGTFGFLATPTPLACLRSWVRLVSPSACITTTRAPSRLTSTPEDT